jgi:hypothetical protein
VVCRPQILSLLAMTWPAGIASYESCLEREKRTVRAALTAACIYPLKGEILKMEQTKGVVVVLYAGGAYIAFYVCAPRTRATSLSPRPIRGLFWLLDGRRHKMRSRHHPRRQK